MFHVIKYASKHHLISIVYLPVAFTYTNKLDSQIRSVPSFFSLSQLQFAPDTILVSSWNPQSGKPPSSQPKE